MENINTDDYYFTWTIERIPDNSIYNALVISNNNISNIVHDATHLRNNIEYTNETDDFIPFQTINSCLHINFDFESVTISSDEDLNCCVCMELKKDTEICQLNCLHKFCSSCVTIHVKKNRNSACCPLCRTNITNISVQTEEDLEIFRNL